MLSNNFAVKSESFALLVAFKRECEAMGWPYDSEFNEFIKENLFLQYPQRALFFSTSWPSTQRPGFSLSVVSKSCTVYQLPTDWNAAIAAAKEALESEKEKNTVRLNDKVVCRVNALKKVVQVVYNEFPRTIESHEFSYEQFGILYDRLKEYQEDSKSVPFTKSMLRSGMLVENASGKLGLVMLNTESGDVIAGYGPKDDSKFAWGLLERFNEDLTHDSVCRDNDIVSVWSGEKLNNRGRARIDTEGRHKIWSRAVGNRSFFIHGVIHNAQQAVAVVVLSRDSVKVGCQTFSHTAIENLHKEISKTK